MLTAAAATRRDDADALIAGRQAAFKLSGATFGGMKAVIDAGGDVTKLGFPAQGAGRLGARDARHVPRGQRRRHDQGAADGVERPRRVRKAAATYEAEAKKLGDLATRRRHAGVAAQWTVVRGTCSRVPRQISPAGQAAPLGRVSCPAEVAPKAERIAAGWRRSGAGR